MHKIYSNDIRLQFVGEIMMKSIINSNVVYYCTSSSYRDRRVFESEWLRPLADLSGIDLPRALRGGFTVVV